MIKLPFEIREAFPWIFLNDSVENIVAWNFWILIFQSLLTLILFYWMYKLKKWHFPPQENDVRSYHKEKPKKKRKKPRKVKEKDVQSPKKTKSKPRKKISPKKEKKKRVKKKEDPFKKFKEDLEES